MHQSSVYLIENKIYSYDKSRDLKVSIGNSSIDWDVVFEEPLMIFENLDDAKDKKGNITVKPKKGNGPGDPTGLNINNY